MQAVEYIYSIEGDVLEWIVPFISNHQQQALCDGVQSQAFDAARCLLVPWHLSVYTDHLPSNLSSSFLVDAGPIGETLQDCLNLVCQLVCLLGGSSMT